MNKYNCSSSICNLVDILSQNLRALEDQILYDNDSFRAALAKASHSMAKKWNKVIPYTVGDLVALDGIVYISITSSNLANNPDSDRENWRYFINPFSTNFGKIKAFVVHQGVNILKSYNIATMSKIDTNASGYGIKSEYKFMFSTPFTQIPSFATSYPEVPNVNYSFEDRGVPAYGTQNTLTYSSIIYTTEAVFNSFTWTSNYSNLDDIVGTVIWYENSETIPIS